MFLKDERVAPAMAELLRCVELNVSSSRWSVELQQHWHDVGLLRSAEATTACTLEGHCSGPCRRSQWLISAAGGVLG